MRELPSGIRGWALATVAATVIVAVLQLPTLRLGFLSDDVLYLEHNPVLQLPPAEAWWPLLSIYFANWTPVHHLLLYLEWHAFGSDPLGYHAVNLLLHAAAAVTLAFAARRAGLSAVAGAIAGLLYLVHPVCVEGVAWISQSKTLLAALFSLVALERWLAHLESPSRARWVAATLAASLALLSKPSVIPLAGLLILAVWTHGRGSTRFLRDLLPVAAVGALALWLNLAAQQAHGGVAPWWFGGSRTATLQILPWVMWRYVRLGVLPADASFAVHPDPTAGWLDPRFALPLLALVVTTVVLYRAVRGCPRRLLAVAWFVGMLLPVLQIVPTLYLFADRYLHVALPASMMLLAEPLARGVRASDPRARRLGVAVLLLFVLGFSAATVQRARIWADPEALFREATERWPLGRTGWTGFGAERYRWGDLDGAAAAYRRSLEVFPGDGHVRLMLARVRIRQGEAGRALWNFEEMLRLAPVHPQLEDVQRMVRKLRAEGVRPVAEDP